MGNVENAVSIYRPSALRIVLQTARERSVKTEVRTKKGLSEMIGISKERVADIENGFSRVSLDEALTWCDICEDKLARQAVLHIFGVGRPPTDPRLIHDLGTQLFNFMIQAKQGIEAAEYLLKMMQTFRPGIPLTDSQKNIIRSKAEEIEDTDQASDCTLDSIEENLGVNRSEIISSWTSEAISDHVAVRSVDQLVAIERERALGW